MQIDARFHELNLADELFAKYVSDYNAVLNGIVQNMNEQQVEEAEVTTKMTVKLDLIDVPNPTSANINGYRQALVPTIKHTIASTIKIKNEKKGCVPEGYELIMDVETGKFVLVKVSDGQCSMYDDAQVRDEYGSQIDADATVYDAPAEPEALPEPQRLIEAGEQPDAQEDSEE